MVFQLVLYTCTDLRTEQTLVRDNGIDDGRQEVTRERRQECVPLSVYLQGSKKDDSIYKVLLTV